GGRCFPPCTTRVRGFSPQRQTRVGEPPAKGSRPCNRKGGRPGGNQTLRHEARGAALPSGSPPGMGQRRTPRCWGARRRIAESDAAAAETASLVPGALRLELPAVRGPSLQRGGFPAPGAILLRSRPGNGQRPHSANPPPESPAARTG